MSEISLMGRLSCNIQFPNLSPDITVRIDKIKTNEFEISEIINSPSLSKKDKQSVKVLFQQNEKLLDELSELSHQINIHHSGINAVIERLSRENDILKKTVEKHENTISSLNKEVQILKNKVADLDEAKIKLRGDQWAGIEMQNRIINFVFKNIQYDGNLLLSDLTKLMKMIEIKNYPLDVSSAKTLHKMIKIYKNCSTEQKDLIQTRYEQIESYIDEVKSYKHDRMENDVHSTIYNTPEDFLEIMDSMDLSDTSIEQFKHSISLLEIIGRNPIEEGGYTLYINEEPRFSCLTVDDIKNKLLSVKNKKKYYGDKKAVPYGNKKGEETIELDD